MNLAYFPNQVALNGRPVLDAFLAGCQRLGIKTSADNLNADAALIWSVLWHGRMQGNQSVYRHYRAQNKPVIVVEVGALYRNSTWKIAVNDITALGYYGHTVNLDLDRPKKLGVSLADLPIAEPHIVIAAQHHASLQVEDISSMENWINEKIIALRSLTDRPIVVRPHPRSKLDLNALPKTVTIQHPRRIQNTYDEFDMHYNCHAVINHNSGPGIQAAISGVRPVVDPSSLAYPVSMQIHDIEKPYCVDRENWLIEMCHTEYTLEEIKKGSWFARLEPAL